MFPFILNEQRRIVDDPLQWIIQRRRGTAGPKRLGWEPIRFHASRDHMLKWVQANIRDLDVSASRRSRIFRSVTREEFSTSKLGRLPAAPKSGGSAARSRPMPTARIFGPRRSKNAEFFSES